MTQGGNEEKRGGRLIVGLDYTLSYLLAFHPSSENVFERDISLPARSLLHENCKAITKCTLCGQEVKEDNQNLLIRVINSNIEILASFITLISLENLLPHFISQLFHGKCGTLNSEKSLRLHQHLFLSIKYASVTGYTRVLCNCILA